MSRLIANSSRPLRHLSVRVPWHDSGWSGKVCSAPQLNGACAKLKGIAADKNDELEMTVAGKTLNVLSEDQWPCCVSERGAFMAPFEIVQTKHHALAKKSPAHYGHFRPTSQRYPPYSFGVVPFRWMMVEHLSEHQELYELDLDASREPDLGYKTNWVHEVMNQTHLLNGFAAHLQNDRSLCLIYAKHVPFIEGTARVLVGVGHICDIGDIQEYDREGQGMRGMVWERPVQHSLRPKGKDGFLMPYDKLLQLADEDASLDLARYTAMAPSDHWGEFSYASELVTHDGAIGALLAVNTTLERMETELGISVNEQKGWLQQELIRLWKVRGPFPGLGAVLSAFGLSRGVFVAHALQEKAGENADPWPFVGDAFNSPGTVLPIEFHKDLRELAPTWSGLPHERREFLRLLSRFELSKGQAADLYDEGSRRKKGLGGTDREILQNPYRIYELSRHDPEGVSLATIDRGVFPEDVVRLKHPLPSPSGLESAVDLRRVRALAVSVLEAATSAGDTLLGKDDVVEAIRTQPIRPECAVTGDTLSARIAELGPEIVAAEIDGGTAL